MGLIAIVWRLTANSFRGLEDACTARAIRSGGSRAALSFLDGHTLREVGLHPGQLASAPTGLDFERLRGPWHV